MNIKDEISKFRSELLMGRYDSAIHLGRQIMAQLQLFTRLGVLKDDRLLDIMQQQYEKCLSLKALLTKPQTAASQQVKKWSGKPKESKWRKPMRQNETSSPNKQEEQEQQPGDKSTVQVRQGYGAFLDRIEQEIMMPIKMPTFFKGKQWHCKVVQVPQESYAPALSLFIQNEFMTVDYPAFMEEFAKEEADNFFRQDGVGEILVDCRVMDRREICRQVEQLKCNNQLQHHHCVFLLIGQRPEYGIKDVIQ